MLTNEDSIRACTNMVSLFLLKRSTCSMSSGKTNQCPNMIPSAPCALLPRHEARKGSGLCSIQKGLANKTCQPSCTLNRMPICNHRSPPYAQTYCNWSGAPGQTSCHSITSWCPATFHVMEFNATFSCKHMHCISCFACIQRGSDDGNVKCKVWLRTKTKIMIGFTPLRCLV